MTENEPKPVILAQVGLRILKARTKAGISRRLLSESSGVSPRYIAQMEAGEGNISIALLQKVATALDIGIEWFFWPEDPWLSEFSTLTHCFREADEVKRTRALRILRSAQEGDHKSNRVCLIGLRGAGKSTLGKLVAQDLDVPFVELNSVISNEGGMPISEIIALYGENGYRQLEADALETLIADYDRVVVAASGGIVENLETYQMLQANFHCIWLTASPDDHMKRVLAQGDTRPVIGQRQVMQKLRGLLASREKLYAMSDYKLETSQKPLEKTAAQLIKLIQSENLLG